LAPPPNNHGVPVRDDLGLEVARRVVDTAPLEIGQPGHVKTSIVSPTGDDHRACVDVVLVVEADAET
jgi:hypothetical protein